MDNVETNYGSRKLWITIGSGVLIVVSGLISLVADPAKVSAFVGIYPTMVGGILALNGVYQGFNVATKWVNGKVESDSTEVEPDPKPEEPKKE